MHFALLSDHPDGLDMARALAASGRHDLRIYSGPAPALQALSRHGLTPRVVADLEEVLADSEIDAVIVAAPLALRPAQLRRALQAECHVLCVHPADPGPDIAYEAAMIQADTGRVLLPILPMTLHPALQRVAEFVRAGPMPRLLELEIWAAEEVLLETLARRPTLPGWDALRFLGGEIGEVFVQSVQGALRPSEPIVLSGRFVSGTLFQSTYLPNQADSRWRLALVTTTGRASLEFAHGWRGPAQWTWTDAAGASHAESWQAHDPFAALVERFEQAVESAGQKKPMPGQPADDCLTKTPPRLGWQDELRGLELDDAARRSAEKGRASTLDLQETTEEASFKGTMTLLGCSLIWLALIVLILSAWIPWLAWLILPLFAVFLLMQALRWVLPAVERKEQEE